MATFVTLQAINQYFTERFVIYEIIFRYFLEWFFKTIFKIAALVDNEPNCK